MKRPLTIIVIALVLAAGLPAAAFFGMGLFNPTISYKNSVTINKTKDEVWAAFIDESNTKKWLKGLQSIELVSGEKGKPGSKYKLLIQDKGEMIPIFETMKKIEPGRLYSFTLDAEPLTNEVTTTFRDQNGVTVMEQNEVVRGKNLFWRSLFFWLQSTFQANSMENLMNFKRFLEGQ